MLDSLGKRRTRVFAVGKSQLLTNLDAVIVFVDEARMLPAVRPPPLLHWIAPRTALPGILKNNPWLPAACSRAITLFSDKALHGPATVLAGVHEAAIDYITQAPVLVVAAAGRSDLSLQDDRERIAIRFKAACSARPRLKELMRFYGVAPQLRVLSGDVLRPYQYRLLKPLSDIPPSRLAQVIPSETVEQAAWLEAARTWRNTAQLVQHDVDWIVSWAAGNGCHRHRRLDIHDIIDFACRDRAAFNIDWSFEEAAAASARWHATIFERAFEADYTPEQMAAVVDYGALPVEVVVDGHTFTALRSRQQIVEEGRAMHHCVATYADRVTGGRCWIYSISRDGVRVATLELRRNVRWFALGQIKAHRNGAPPAETTAAATHFIAQVNAAAAVAAAAEEAVRREKVPERAMKRRR